METAEFVFAAYEEGVGPEGVGVYEEGFWLLELLELMLFGGGGLGLGVTVGYLCRWVWWWRLGWLWLWLNVGCRGGDGFVALVNGLVGANDAWLQHQSWFARGQRGSGRRRR